MKLYLLAGSQETKSVSSMAEINNVTTGGIPPFLHNSPTSFESYAKNRYAKLCTSMQNYAKVCKIMQKNFFENLKNLK